MILLRRFTVWGALLGIAILVVMVQRTTRTEPVPPPPVTPALRPGDSIGAAGIVEAHRENTSIGVPVSGLVKAVPVRVWDVVEPGDLLLELDDREVTAQLRSEEAELRIAEAELARARRQLERTEALRAAGTISEDAADEDRDQVRIQEARRAAATARADRTRIQLERMKVRAPVGGTVLQVNTRPGEHVMTGAAEPPVLLGSLEELQVRADVDEQLAPQVRPGAPATGYLKGDTRRPIPMEFVRIEPYVVPKRSLTGGPTERVDTRVLQVIYRFARAEDRRVYVGQQMELYLEP